MKKQFFTFLMMIALVIVAGSAMAQTNLAPYANGTTKYSYTWNGVDPAGATHGFYVMNAAPTAAPTASNATGTEFTILTAGGDAATSTGATATVKITWDNTAATKAYYVTFVATNATCTNFRYVQVNPKAPVDFAIYAIGVTGNPNGADLTLPTGNKDGLTECPPSLRVDADYLSTSGTVNDGKVYVFFRVERLNGTATNDWTIDLTTTVSAGAITSTQYSPDGTTWSGSTTNSAITEFMYVRVEIPVPTVTTAKTVSSTIVAATTFETLASGLTATDYLATNNGPKTFTVSPVPAIGGFVTE